MGAEVDDFESVRGGFGFEKNVVGEIILNFADVLNFAVANTLFEKNEISLG